MIKSMTGFASSEITNDNYQISISIKSVNSRYLEIFFFLPDFLSNIEFGLRNIIKKAVARGKLTVTINVKKLSQGDDFLLNEKLAQSLIKNLSKICKINPQQESDTNVQELEKRLTEKNAMEILKYPGVLYSNAITTPGQDLNELVIKTFNETLAKFDQSRIYEGEHLKNFITEHLNTISNMVSVIKSNMPDIVNWQRSKIQEIMDNHNVKLDSNILEQEIIIFAQKIDISEELNRLTSHIDQTQGILQNGGVVGKKLDFLMQEFNRESNTIASKSVNIEVTDASVELKVQIEQMREQVQNIE